MNTGYLGWSWRRAPEFYSSFQLLLNVMLVLPCSEDDNYLINAKGEGNKNCTQDTQQLENRESTGLKMRARAASLLGSTFDFFFAFSEARIAEISAAACMTWA